MRPSRFNFTVAGINNLPTPTKKRVSYRDAQVPELGLLVQPTGTKSFFWFRKVAGRPTWRTIGAFPSDVSLEQARNKAREYSAKLGSWKLSGYRSDANPFEKRRGEPTFSELVEDYIARHVKGHAKRPEKAEGGIRWLLKKYLSAWKDRKLGMIRRADAVRLHQELGQEHRVTANRVLQFVRTVFNWAIREELWQGENPAARVTKFSEQERKRFLQPDELARLWTALRQDPNRHLRDFVNLALWTGARKMDVLGMRWQDLSFNANSWSVPDPKGEPYVVPLDVETLKILKERWRRRVGDSPFVFPSHGKSGHVVDLKKRWKELLKRAQLSDLRQHDLRRTQGSWQAAQGTSLLVIGKALGHRSTDATQIYAQLQLDPVREAMAAANKAMRIAAKKKQPKLLKMVANG